MNSSDTWPQTRSQVDDLDRALDDVTQHVYRYARFRMMNTQDAEDATMETLHALRQAPVPFLQANNPIFYAIGVCRRKIANISRANRFSRFFRKPDSDWASRSERHVVIGQTLARLSPEHREVLGLKYFHEFSLEEIADLIGRSSAATNSLLQRAREAFAEQAPAREAFE